MPALANLARSDVREVVLCATTNRESNVLWHNGWLHSGRGKVVHTRMSDADGSGWSGAELFAGAREMHEGVMRRERERW